MTIKPKIGTCIVCNKTDKPLMKKMCCDRYMSCYEKQRWARYNEKRKAAIGNTEVRSRKPIAKHSTKRAKEEREYSVKAKAFKLANPDCAARVKAGCTGGTEDIHHMAGKIGSMLLDEFYWLPVCRACHNWIEMNPLSAKKLGLSVSRLETNEAAA